MRSNPVVPALLAALFAVFPVSEFGQNNGSSTSGGKVALTQNYGNSSQRTEKDAAQARRILHSGLAADASTGFTTLYSCSIEAANCATPSGLILDGAGNLYGTAGTVFELNTANDFSVLYTFGTNSMDGTGAGSDVPLVRDGEGNLYGTSANGGANSDGFVFKVDSGGTETVLYSFGAEPLQADGWDPTAGLVRDSAGNLYGTTKQGGSHGFGTVFEVDNAGKETVLYSFDATGSGLDGYSPQAGLIRDAAGNLYGTTTQGGASETVSGGTASDGVAFKLDTAGNETVLYSFCTQPNCADGTDPVAGLVEDGAGNFYGTTSGGGTGAYTVSGNPEFAGGTVFKIDTAGNETVLYNFCAQVNCADGAVPMAGLVMDSAGNLYGTTQYGGANSPIGLPQYLGAGTIFKIDPAGNETVLYNFCSQANCADGWEPVTGLTLDGSGNLFGTTSGLEGDIIGTIFELAGGGVPPIVATPQFSPAGGTYSTAQTVEISDGTAGTKIYYTTDGTTPTTGSAVYDGSIAVSETTTIKAIATKAGYTQSAVATATYTIESLIATQLTLTGNPNPGTVGGTVVFTVQVKPSSGTGTPTGMVTTTIDGSAGPALTLSGGAASFSLSTLTAGKHTIVATYAGDSSYSGSSATLVETITSGGAVPRVSLSATSLAFGSATVGTTTASQYVALTNTGDATLSIASIAVTGADASSFVFGNTCGTSVAAGASCSIHGHFAPVAAGALTAAITITDNAGNSPQTIALSGTGIEPPVSLSAASLSYGSVIEGEASGSQSVTLTNNGTAALSISSIALTGADASSFVFANTCGTSVAAGASCTIHGHFAPVATGALTAAVTITDSASTSPQTIALSGTGVERPVTLSAYSLNYGSVNEGSASASQYVTVTNTGTASVTFASIAVTGADASSFVFGNTCGASLAVGASCTIHGHFAPVASGALTAAITITDSAATSPQTIALSGTGVAPAGPVTLSASSLAFPATTVGTSSGSQSVTMTNTGTAVLTITSIALTGADASSFVFANTCGTSLAVGASCSIHGHFAPVAAGALTAAVTITDSAAGSPQSIALSGTGN